MLMGWKFGGSGAPFALIPGWAILAGACGWRAPPTADHIQATRPAAAALAERQAHPEPLDVLWDRPETPVSFLARIRLAGRIYELCQHGHACSATS